jgi:hypothetical protein
MSYFLEYRLGIPTLSGLAAEKGTICHKVLEILALINYTRINKGKFFIDDVLGKVSVAKNPDIDKLTEKVYNVYSSNSHHVYKDADLKFCKKSVHTVLDFGKGQFDPRNLNIVAPERHFNFPIKRDWAKYKYEIGEKTYEGYLSIKGTVDLTIKDKWGNYEIVDYKTGKRKDWNTGEEKTFASMKHDPQLRIYHYAHCNTFPETENLIITLFYTTDGGPFSIPFDKSDLPETEDMIRKQFERIKNCEIPKQNRTWKCKNLCHFKKHYFKNSPLEFRDGQFDEAGEKMCMCSQVEYELYKRGYDFTSGKYIYPGFDIGYYKDPGTVN